MSNTIRISVTVDLDVDLDVYADTYGIAATEAETDARAHVRHTVANLLAVNPSTNTTPRPGQPVTVGADDAGVTLTGPLATLVDH